MKKSQHENIINIMKGKHVYTPLLMTNNQHPFLYQPQPPQFSEERKRIKKSTVEITTSKQDYCVHDKWGF